MRLAILLLAATLLAFPLVRTSPDVRAAGSVPAQGTYMVKQLQLLTAHNWARVAGRDTNLPPEKNGHDEFASAWTHAILANLHGLPVGVYRQTFTAPGFRGLPASRPGVNVIVTVAGRRDPGHSILIVAHYDGEPSSLGSAFDDASGTVLMLGAARTLGNLWRSQGLPSQSVQFVLFDAEEQGLVGSSVYAFDLGHGALLPHPSLVIDEEQSGVGYPARPFGLLTENALPTYAVVGDPIPQALASRYPVKAWNPRDLKLLTDRLTADGAAAFHDLHAAYPSVRYRGGTASAFTPADQHLLVIGPTHVCCSDNLPFDALGLPSALLAGNSDFYSASAPDWSFPFDQPWDTVAAMACDSEGSPQPGPVLAAALDLPQRLTVDLVQQYAPAGRGDAKILVLSSLPRSNTAVHLAVSSGGSARWSFGDGATASGSSVTHRFARAGAYHITVAGNGSSGSFRVSATLRVSGHQPSYLNAIPLPLSPPRVRDWHPPELQSVAGCH